MTTIAELIVEINATSAETAADKMDGATAASDRLESQTQKTAATVRSSAASYDVLAAEARKAMAGVIGMDDAALHADATLRQMARSEDLVTAALGPLAADIRAVDAALGTVGKQAAAAAGHFDTLYEEMDRDFAGQYVAQLKRVDQALDSVGGAHIKAGKAMKLTSNEALNFGRQFADIGTSLAGGMNPLLILAQQGPQIADGFAMAGQRGMGFKAVLGELVGMAAPLWPIAAVVGAIATAIAVPLAVGAQKSNEHLKELSKTLDLDATQMARLKKEGVDMGDVLGATFEVLGDRIMDAFGKELKAVGKWFKDLYDGVIGYAVDHGKKQLGIYIGTYRAVKAVWGDLPAALGDIAVTAANNVLQALEGMVNKAIGYLNGYIETANLAPRLAGVRIQLPTFAEVDWDEIANKHAGAANRVGQTWAKEMKAGFGEADKFIDDLLHDIGVESVRNAAGEKGKAKKGDRDPVLSDYAKALEGIRDEVKATKAAAAAQLDWNTAVASGTKTVEEANQARDWAIKAAGIEAAAGKMSEAQHLALTAALKVLGVEYDKLNKIRAEGDQAAANRQAAAGFAEQIEYLRLEASLIGAGNVQRAVELAQLREKQAILRGKPAGYTLTGDDYKRIGGAQDVARAQVALAIGQDLYNDALDETLTRLERLDDLVGRTFADLANAFDGASESAGKYVRSLGGVLGAVTKLGLTEQRVNRERTKSYDDVQAAIQTADPGLIIRETIRDMELQRRTAAELKDAQVGAYAEMAGAAKGFFEEGTAGYQAMQAAEIAFRTIQMAESLKAMAQFAIETVAHIFNSEARAAASVTAGAANFFEQSGWGGFVGVAAMMAVMAGLGFGGGGGASGGAYDLQDVQSRQGTGSVLGDATAKSESIANALDLVADHTNDQLEYSNSMLRALRNIDSGIQNLTAAIARSLGVGGFLNSEGVDRTINRRNSFQTGNGFTNPVIMMSGPLPTDPLGLFDTKMTRKLVDAGISFANQTLADALTKGVDAETFQTIQNTTTQKLFGIFSSSKTKTKTTMADLDPEIARQFSLVLGSLKDGVIEAAKVLGVEGVGGLLDSFQLEIGKISFKDMKGDEISAALEAVFSKVGDDMAKAVIPGLGDLQKAGEGLFETLIRVARRYQVVDVTLASIGKTFGAVGLSSLAAREHLVDLFGGLDEFADQVGFYGENFLTEAERLAPIRAAVTAEFARLGIAGLDTRDEFKQLVQGLDLSTAAGANLFAALMALAPGFAAITEETKAVADARDALSDAYGRERDELLATRDKAQGIFDSLGDYLGSLYRGPVTALTPEQQYLADKAEFDRVRALALGGDVNALGDLQEVSQAYLDASRAYFASSAGYFGDLEAVRAAVTAAQGIAGQQVTVADQQLDQLKAAVTGILDLNESVLSVAQALANYQAAIASAYGTGNTPVVITQAGVPTIIAAPTTGTVSTPLPVPTLPSAGGYGGGVANDNSDVVAELQAMRRELAEVRAELQTANSQRGAVAMATLDKMERQTEAMEGQRRIMMAQGAG